MGGRVAVGVVRATEALRLGEVCSIGEGARIRTGRPLIPMSPLKRPGDQGDNDSSGTASATCWANSSSGTLWRSC